MLYCLLRLNERTRARACNTAKREKTRAGTGSHGRGLSRFHFNVFIKTKYCQWPYLVKTITAAKSQLCADSSRLDAWSRAALTCISPGRLKSNSHSTWTQFACSGSHYLTSFPIRFMVIKLKSELFSLSTLEATASPNTKKLNISINLQYNCSVVFTVCGKVRTVEKLKHI